MKKNEVYVGEVQAIGSNGEGIIKEGGTVVFVPFALVGEKIKYKILKVTSKCAFAKVEDIIVPSKNRVKPICSVFGKCGGCQLQHVEYNGQLKFKEETVKNCFNKIANLKVEVKPSVFGDECVRYRNKLQLPVAENNGRTVIGFYAENSHRVIEIDECFINATWTKDVIRSFKQYINEFSIKGYNEQTNTGDMREIVVKEIKNNLIITVVSLSDKLKGTDRLIEIIKENLKIPFSLFINVNTRNTNVIFGDVFKLIYGPKDYTSNMLGIDYKIGVQSFMQVNTCVCEKLYSAVKQLVDADENTTVIDAYSGAGLMTAILAKDAKKAIGIEIVKEAVKLADELAVNNALDKKIRNYLGKCEDILPDIIKKETDLGNKTCLVLDPPRKGCDIKVINSIIKSGVEKIVCVSCLPSTLARDVGLIIGSLEVVDGQVKRVDNPTHRYTIESVQTFDMFAQTKHVETVVCLTKTV